MYSDGVGSDVLSSLESARLCCKLMCLGCIRYDT